VKPLTLSAVIHAAPATGPAHTLRQTITRTADRIHVAADDRREWLFERNAIDSRRVSAALVEHASRVIVLYEESDLRNRLGIRGWADVLSLGFDPRILKGLTATEEVRSHSGIRFLRYAAGGMNASTQEVWWSDEQALPSAFVTRDDAGVTRFSIERIRGGVDAPLLQHPAFRFRAYRVVDLADWLERR
jgi:hypothetical protein